MWWAARPPADHPQPAAPTYRPPAHTTDPEPLHSVTYTAPCDDPHCRCEATWTQTSNRNATPHIQHATKYHPHPNITHTYNSQHATATPRSTP